MSVTSSSLTGVLFLAVSLGTISTSFAAENGFETKLRVKGGVDGKREYLSVSQDCGGNVDLWSIDPITNTQGWTMTQLTQEELKDKLPQYDKDKGPVFVISSNYKASQGCANRYLSASTSCEATYVDLWEHVDVAQMWYAHLQGRDARTGGDNLVLSNVYRDALCPSGRLNLSTNGSGDTVDMWSGEDERQQWVMDVPKLGEQIAAVSGRWETVAGCEGCPSSTYEFSEGIEASESNEWAREQSDWTEAAVTASMGVSGSYLAASATASASATGTMGASDTITSSVASSFKVTQGSKLTFTCDKAHFLVWTTEVKQHSVAGVRAVTANSKRYKCTDEPNPPAILAPKG